MRSISGWGVSPFLYLIVCIRIVKGKFNWSHLVLDPPLILTNPIPYAIGVYYEGVTSRRSEAP